MALDWRALDVTQTGREEGRCACCGGTTISVFGLVSLGPGAVAAYFVRWTDQRPDHGAAFNLVLGRWGEGVGGEERFLVALDLKPGADGPAFAVVDAADRLPPNPNLFSDALRSEEVIGTPIADNAFAVADAIYRTDPDVIELETWTA